MAVGDLGGGDKMEDLGGQVGGLGGTRWGTRGGQDGGLGGGRGAVVKSGQSLEEEPLQCVAYQWRKCYSAAPWDLENH